MDRNYYTKLAENVISGEGISESEAIRIIEDPSLKLLPLLDAAFEVRSHFCGHTVAIHIINNVKNGACPEDCNYCAQGQSSEAEIETYITKPDDEILDEAAKAYESGAHRYCMVYSGTGPSQERAEKIAELVRKIKSALPIEVCVSAGIMGESAIKIMKDAGLDRLNHNLNTSRSRYPSICTTHTYEDRIGTLTHAAKHGLQICSGIIAGMGETNAERVELALELRKAKARSIPVNFLIPIQGNALTEVTGLTPETALRILCMFRFLNPDAEIRAAAGREQHLRSMEVMALYPANSLFMNGYLNTKGSGVLKTLQMIKDAGFTIESDKELDALIQKEIQSGFHATDKALLKTVADLRPTLV
jgi:biotin synthase